MNIDAAQLAQAARRLQIPVPSENIVREILTLEGTMLVRQLDEARKGSHQASMYLRGVMLACHDNTVARLSRKGAPPSIAALVNLGKAEGPQFGERVKEWAEAGYPADGALARYVRLTLARELEAQARASTPGTPPDRPAAPALVNPGDYRPNRGTPGQAAQERAAAQQPAPRTQQRESDRPAPPPWEDDDPLAPPPASSEPQRQVSGGHRPEPRDDEPVQRREPASSRAAAPAPAPSRDTSGQRQEGVQARGDGEQREEYLSQHIYGGKAAACFSADVTRGGTFTVRIEAATSSGARQYDWQRKLAIQLSQRELPLVLAVFMGWLPIFEGKGHGENNSKWFTLENQGNKLYLSLNAKGSSPRGVPIMPGDGYAVTTLLMRQMLKNDPFLSPEILLSLVRKEAALSMGEVRQPARAAA